MIDYRELLRNIPPGLNRVILQVLEFHQGRMKAITKDELIKQLAVYGFKVDERQFRECVRQMRQEGILICSTASNPAGYYLPTSALEVDEFLEKELIEKRNDLSKTIEAMQSSKRLQFGDGTQLGLGL